MPPKKKTGKAQVPAKKAETSPSKNKQNISELYEKMLEGKEVMNDEIFFGFLEKQLQIAPDDLVVGHIVTNVMKLTKIDQITLQQFQSLFNYSGSNDQTELKNNIKNLRTEANQDIHFKAMYKGIYPLYIGNHTTLDLDVAEQLWGVYLVNKFNYYKQWMAYLQSMDDKENKKIHKDLWNMVLQFAYDVKDVKDYSDQDGWPLFIDEFVEFIKK